ncbi:MAG: hypothetical protein IJC12_03655 [Peptococcaceae bacterium]|nr:hypothetical protein [Peptococcaceae bacterium]
MAKKNIDSEKKTIKETVAKKLIIHFFLENEQKYFAQNNQAENFGENEYIKIKTDQDIIHALQNRYREIEDFQNENGGWEVISEKEYEDIKAKSAAETWSGIDVDGFKISDSTFDSSIRKLKEDGYIYTDENGEMHYAEDSLYTKRKIHPILNLASQISIKATEYKYFRCFFTDKKYVDAIVTWLNSEFQIENIDAYCIGVENIILVFASWQEENKENYDLDKVLKILFRNAKFKYSK